MKLLKQIILPILFGLLIAVIYLFMLKSPLNLNHVDIFKHKSNPNQNITFAAAVQKSSPSVVTIYTQHKHLNNASRRQSQSNLGSGVIITANGLIITNSHVIQNATNILVLMSDGRSASAIVVGEDKETDIAILKIPFRNLPAISVRSSKNLLVGDIVLAIGNPLNVGQTVTMGIISATGRNRVGINTYENFIQTDASINPGNSGGALIDTEGNMIGINTAIFSQSGGSQGIGFAIPMDLALDIMQELLENGRISRGWFGVNGVDNNEFDINGAYKGVFVADVFSESPAAIAGLKTGDYITHINMVKIKNIRDVVDQVATFKPGTIVPISIDRHNKKIDLNLLITERPIE